MYLRKIKIVPSYERYFNKNDNILYHLKKVDEIYYINITII